MRTNTAFTLIELLVVISITAALAGMLLPVVGMVRSSARTATCSNLLRQYQMANSAYADANDGCYVQIRSGTNPALLPQWLLNPAYTELLEIAPSSLFPVRMLCPESYAVAHASNGKALTCYSYGFNIEGTAGTSLNGVPLDLCHWRISQVRRPSQKVAICDALDWWVAASGTSTYTTEKPVIPSQMPGAFRHRGRLGAAFFDGHVETLARNAIDVATSTSFFNLHWRVNAP